MEQGLGLGGGKSLLFRQSAGEWFSLPLPQGLLETIKEAREEMLRSTHNDHL